MAVIAHIVERTTSQGTMMVEGIRACIVAVDDTTYDTDEKIRIQAAALISAAKGFVLPADYFDVNRPVTDYATDEDITVFGAQHENLLHVISG